MSKILASQEDVEARLRRELTEAESSHIDSLLEEASSLVTEYCRGREFGDDIPDAVRIVTSRVAARSLSSPDGNGGVQVLHRAAGNFSLSQTYTSEAANGGVYLSSVDRKQLRRWARIGAESFDTR